MQRRIRKEFFRSRTISLFVSQNWWLIFILAMTGMILGYGASFMKPTTFEVTGFIFWITVNVFIIGLLIEHWKESARMNLWLDDEGAKQGHSLDTSQGRTEALIAKIRSENRSASRPKPPSGRNQSL